MAIIEIPYPFRTYTEGKQKVEVAGSSVLQALQELIQRFPRIAPHLFDTYGRLRQFILIYLNDEDIRYLQGLETPVKDDGVLRIIPSLAGGTDEYPNLPLSKGGRMEVITYDVFGYMAVHKHERLILHSEPISGLRAVIALHNTARGPALGGVRLWNYCSSEAAIRDALRLSEAMSDKAAVAEVPYGGGKAIILADGKEKDPSIRRARFRAFGHLVESLGGSYITTEDVGTTPADIAQINCMTGYVVGAPAEEGGSGDPSRMTAFGVLQGIKALAEEVLGITSLVGVPVAIQGLGAVGLNLAKDLIAEGAIVIGADIRTEVVKEAKRQLNIDVVAPDAIYDVPATIFVPCALGAVLNDQTIPRLTCKIVAGSANNQLEDERHAEILHRRGIVYGVDYVLNAGGLINVVQELNGYDEQKARERTALIYDTVKRMLTISRSQGISTQYAARRMAFEALQIARESHQVKK